MPFIYLLPRKLAADDVITVQGVPSESCRRFRLVLQKGNCCKPGGCPEVCEQTLFFMDVSFSVQNLPEVLFGSPRGKKWMNWKRLDTFPFEIGVPYTIKV
jgi:hypothetical protein